MKNNSAGKNNKKGIALFVAVVAVSALLLISVAIADIAFKEQILSYAGKESKIAFYAADTGLECVLFHDLKVSVNGSNFFAHPGQSPPPENILKCRGENIQSEIDTSVDECPTLAGGTGDCVLTRFSLSYSNPLSCAIVEISKTEISDGIETRVVSRGYNNTCNSSGELDIGPRNLERALEVFY